MAFPVKKFGFKPPAVPGKFHMPSETKKIAAETRRRPVGGMQKKMRINTGLAPASAIPKIKF